MKPGICDDQEEVRAGSYRLRRVWRFSLDYAVGRTGSNLQWEREIAQRDAGDFGTAGFKNGAALLADADRRRAGEREADGLKIESADLILALSGSEPM